MIKKRIKQSTKRKKESRREKKEEGEVQINKYNKLKINK
jgi:hypothetical protein